MAMTKVSSRQAKGRSRIQVLLSPSFSLGLVPEANSINRFNGARNGLNIRAL